MNRIIAALGLVALATSCGPPWQIRAQASPSPFTGDSTFAVAPVDEGAMGVGDKSEKAFLEGKDEDTRAQWTAAKKALAEDYAKVLAAKAAQSGVHLVAPGSRDAFTVSPVVKWVEPGFFAQAAAASSRVKMVVTIASPAGAVLDSIDIEHGTPASTAHETIESRLRDDGASLGEVTADYLKSRVAPTK